MSDGVRVALFFAALFAAAAINTAFLPLWFADRGLDAIAIGQVLGAAALLRVFAGPSWGTVADRIGRKPVMLAAAMTATVAALLYIPSHGFLPLLLVAAVQGVASSALNPLIDSLALALARDGRMEYGKVRSIGSIAYMAASAGPGWLLSITGSWLVPWLLAASYGAGAIVTPLLPETAGTPGARRSLTGLHLFANRPFRLAVFASALIQGAHAAYYGFAPLFWRAHGLSDGVIGVLIAEGIVAEVALFAWGRCLIERLGPAGLTACAADCIAGSLERHGLRTAAPAACGDPTAARRDVRDAASLGDAGPKPVGAPGACRNGAGAAYRVRLRRARRPAGAACRISLRALRWAGLPGHGGDRRRRAVAGPSAARQHPGQLSCLRPSPPARTPIPPAWSVRRSKR